MTDLKTTIAGILAAAVQVLSYFHIMIPQDLANAITTIAIAIGLYFAKDKIKN